MAYEQKNNSGAIFPNDRKTEENHPDRTGEALIDGKPYRVSGWLKKSKGGTTYLSLAFTRKDERAPAKSPKPDGGRIQDMEDDIPW